MKTFLVEWGNDILHKGVYEFDSKASLLQFWSHKRYPEITRLVQISV